MRVFVRQLWGGLHRAHLASEISASPSMCTGMTNSGDIFPGPRLSFPTSASTNRDGSQL